MPRTAIGMPRTLAGNRTTAGVRFTLRDPLTCIRGSGTGTVQIPTNAGLQTEDVTYMAWIYQTAYASANSYVFAKRDGTNGALSLRLDSTGHLFAGVSAAALAASSTVIPLNTWAHVCITRKLNGATYDYNYYINGNLDKTITGDSNAFVNTKDIWIANRQGGGTTTEFIGDIDEVAAFNAELTAAQVLACYKAQQYSLSSLKLLLKFDEGSGSSAGDSSGNNNNGTIFSLSYATNKYMTPTRMAS